MRKIKIIIFCLFIFLTNAKINAAYITFIPKKIIQPDGKIIECFISGDENNNWLHNEAGYTILKDQNSGYFTYAIPIDNFEQISLEKYSVKNEENQISIEKNSTQKSSIINIKPSNLIVGIDEIPENLPKWLIPEKNNENDILIKKFNKKVNSEFLASNKEKNKGKFCNVVVFLKLAGDEDFVEKHSFFEKLFNSKTSASLSGYFKEVSYEQLDVYSIIPDSASQIVVFEDEIGRAHV